MGWSYERLWIMLIQRKMNKSALREKAGLTTAALAHMGKAQNLVEVGMGVSIISRLATTAGIQPDLAALPIADNNAFRTVCFVT